MCKSETKSERVSEKGESSGQVKLGYWDLIKGTTNVACVIATYITRERIIARLVVLFTAIFPPISSLVLLQNPCIFAVPSFSLSLFLYLLLELHFRTKEIVPRKSGLAA